MSWKKIVLFAVLVDFVTVAAWGASQVGVVGLFAGMFEGPSAILGTVDLVIALGLICTWMIRDARARGASALPYVLLTPLLGSAAALVYLLRRPETATDPVIEAAVPSHARAS